jgi:hypothetical protein
MVRISKNLAELDTLVTEHEKISGEFDGKLKSLRMDPDSPLRPNELIRSADAVVRSFRELDAGYRELKTSVTGKLGTVGSFSQHKEKLQGLNSLLQNTYDPKMRDGLALVNTLENHFGQPRRELKILDENAALTKWTRHVRSLQVQPQRRASSESAESRANSNASQTSLDRLLTQRREGSDRSIDRYGSLGSRSTPHLEGGLRAVLGKSFKRK